MASSTRKKASSRSTRTRTQLKEEFDNIREDVAGAEETDRVSAELAKTEKNRVRQAIGLISVDSAVQRVTSLGLDLQRALSGVQEQLVAEVKELEDVRKAVEFESQELTRLFNIDVAAASLEALVREYAEKEATFQSKVDQAAVEWARQEEARQRQYRADTDALSQTRLREKEQYEYSKQQERRRVEEDFQDKMRALAKENEVKQELLHKSWQAREDVIRENESEFVGYKNQVHAFPEQLRKEKEAAVAIATNSLKKDLTHAFELERRDMASKNALLEQRIVASDADKLVMAATIRDLQLKLEAANKQVENIAIKSVESVSGQIAMAKMQETIAAGTSNGGSRTKS
jgi:hypothetical protein